MRDRFLLLTGMLAIAIAGQGCTNKATESQPTTSPTSSSSTTTAPATPTLNLKEPDEPKEAIPSGPAKKNYTIGVSLLTQDDEFYKALKKGMEDEAAKQNVSLKVVSADKDLSKQVDQLKNFCLQKVDAIVVCPVNTLSIGGAIGEANKANIPVFTADIAAGSGKVVCHVASDNVLGGKLVGQFVGKLLNGKGKVGILDDQEVSSVVDRVNGFKEGLKEFPGITIVDDENVKDAKRENAVPKASDMITAHSDLDVVFGINDPVALGALSALQQANNTKIAVVGFDAVPEAQTDISSGTSQLKADAIQYPDLIGKTTIDAIVKSLNGEPVPPKIPVPTGLVTSDSFKK